MDADEALPCLLCEGQFERRLYIMWKTHSAQDSGRVFRPGSGLIITYTIYIKKTEAFLNTLDTHDNIKFAEHAGNDERAAPTKFGTTFSSSSNGFETKNGQISNANAESLVVDECPITECRSVTCNCSSIVCVPFRCYFIKPLKVKNCCEPFEPAASEIHHK
jgi:hypothetical protein